MQIILYKITLIWVKYHEVLNYLTKQLNRHGVSNVIILINNKHNDSKYRLSGFVAYLIVSTMT